MVQELEIVKTYHKEQLEEARSMVAYYKNNPSEAVGSPLPAKYASECILHKEIIFSLGAHNIDLTVIERAMFYYDSKIKDAHDKIYRSALFSKDSRKAFLATDTLRGNQDVQHYLALTKNRTILYLYYSIMKGEPIHE